MDKTDASRRYRASYIIGLSFLALMVTASYMSMQRVNADQHMVNRVVNLASLQTGLANRITYLSLLMLTTSDELDFVTTRSQLEQSMQQMEQAHETLLHGDRSEDIPLLSNEYLQKIYYDQSIGLHASLQRFLSVSREVLESEYGGLGVTSYAYSYMTTEGPRLLEPMLGAALEEYKQIGSAQIQRGKRMEWMLWVGTLLVLLLEALLVFRPLESAFGSAGGEAREEPVDELEAPQN